MKRIYLTGLYFALVLLSFSALLLSSCEPEEQLGPPASLYATQGTYLGVVHLTWEAVPNAERYNIQRLDPVSGQWQDAVTVNEAPGDDYGFNLPDNKIVTGTRYQYRIAAQSDNADDSGYIEAGGEGWTYELKDPVVKYAVMQDDGYVRISIHEPNDLKSLGNWNWVRYDVYRKRENDYDFNKVGDTNNLPDVGDSVFFIDHDNPVPDAEYMVKATYAYQYKNMDWGISDGVYLKNSNVVTVKNEGSGEIDYTQVQIGTVMVAAGDKSIPRAEIKEKNGEIYIGMLKDANAAGYGVPEILKRSATWIKVGGTYPSAIMNSTSLGHEEIALSSNTVWLAGLDHDSIYVYGFEGGSWSENITVKNMGAPDGPASMDIEVLNDDLFLALTEAPDYDLKALKWTGTSWAQAGGDAEGWIEKGKDVFNLGLENISGKLYLYYTVQNSTYNSTLNIKHWNGSGWTSDLQWTADNIMDIKIAGDGTNLYFISGSQKPAEFAGGVYRVTSTTTVEALISGSDDWFMWPEAITVDSEGNVFVMTTGIISATEPTYTFMSRYDGSKWKKLSGDFSNSYTPVVLHAIGTDIYDVYGTRINLTSWSDSKVLKMDKFSQ